jgi:hypothetical protein
MKAQSNSEDPNIGELYKCVQQRFLYWQIFAKSLPEKYDFDYRKDFP